MSVEVERVLLTIGASGDLLVGAARDGKRCKLLHCHLIGSAANTLRWESGAGGVALSGVMSFLLGGPYVTPYVEAGIVELIKDLAKEFGTALSLEVVVTGVVAGYALIAYTEKNALS